MDKIKKNYEKPTLESHGNIITITNGSGEIQNDKSSPGLTDSAY